MTIQWKLATLVVTGVAALGLSATPALGQFVIPNMAEDPDSYRDVDEPEKIKTTHNDELDIDVVSGGSEQDMINHAMQELIEEDGGVKAIATGSGLGFVATAVSSYNYAGQNENLSRLQQRLAAVQANLGAKTVLVEFLNGVSVEGQEAIAEQIMALDTETQQDMNTTMSASEQRESAVSGLISGVVTYDFKDDPTGGGEWWHVFRHGGDDAANTRPTCSRNQRQSPSRQGLRNGDRLYPDRDQERPDATKWWSYDLVGRRQCRMGWIRLGAHPSEP